MPAQYIAAVHPRMCGEHGLTRLRDKLSRGSSPHVRGTPAVLKPKLAYRRFIPACAGNTNTFLQKIRRFAVHPRMCGEHSSFTGFFVNVAGSSPHVRGTPRDACWVGDERRFIPACAGNTPLIPKPPILSPVHPRMCGEHRAEIMVFWTTVGSSPHVRGTLKIASNNVLNVRFIPACAGNTGL